MQISANKVVTLKYKLSNHSTGEQIEETNETNPLVFLYGVGGLIPEFEENLADKPAGDVFDFHIIAANAYGDHDPQHMAMIPTNIFHDEEGKFDEQMFHVGALVPMSDNDGNQLRGKIVEVDATKELDLYKDKTSVDATGQLRIVEIEFYEKIK
jgi:FKBP-type peptidyl-prolyl cis-trans isomerase SlyD